MKKNSIFWQPWTSLKKPARRSNPCPIRFTCGSSPPMRRVISRMSAGLKWKCLHPEGFPPPEKVPHLKWVQCNSAGIDRYVEELRQLSSDVMITTLSGVLTGPIAEYILMTLLALGHKIPRLRKIPNRKRTGQAGEEANQNLHAGGTAG